MNNYTICCTTALMLLLQTACLNTGQETRSIFEDATQDMPDSTILHDTTKDMLDSTPDLRNTPDLLDISTMQDMVEMSDEPDMTARCEQDQRVQDNVCVTCDEGLANPSGDDPNGDDTQCVDDPCYIKWRVFCDQVDEAYIKASNTESNDGFGIKLAIHHNTLVVGAPEEGSNATTINGVEQNNLALRSGAVYVFIYKDGRWTQQAYIKAPNAEADDQFGSSVSIHGDTIAVGATREKSNATGVNPLNGQINNDAPSSGAVYVFTRSGATWTHQAYIKASNTNQGDFFGSAVAVDEHTLAVGAFGESSDATGVDADEDNNNAASSGAVYVFTRSNNMWSQQAYIKAQHIQDSALFGSAIALDGDSLAVGAHGESNSAQSINATDFDGSKINSGAAYVFTRSGNKWTQEAYIKASNADASDFFGYSIDLHGDTLAVGAYGEASMSKGVNKAQDADEASESGAAYIFIRQSSMWTQQAYIKASNTGEGDSFGHSIALHDDTLVVGAYLEDSSALNINGNENNDTYPSSGAAYMFERNAGMWTQAAYVKASNTGVQDFFGVDVALDGKRLAIAADGEQSKAVGVNGDQTDDSLTRSGAVYIKRFAP